MVSFGAALACIFAFYHFLSGTTLAPPVDVVPFALSSENLRWMNTSRFVAFSSFFNGIIGVFALYVYALRTEEPIGAQLVAQWMAPRGYEFFAHEESAPLLTSGESRKEL
jgi:site-specific recombinase